MIRVSSFDIFDTCLTRTFAHPVDLFQELGRRAKSRGLTALEPDEFRRRRARAEISARKASPSREVTLEEIYRQLELGAGFDAEAAAKLQEMELQLEEESLRPVRETQRRIVEARGHGRLILFLSDMYLPSSFLQRLLAAHGMFVAGDRLHVSGELRVGKGNGKLFLHARAKLKETVADWTHFGDSRHSDVEVPARLAISAEHFTGAHLNRYERRLCPGPVRGEAWRSRLAGAMRLARLARPPGLSAREKVIWDTGANVAGPLFYGYVKWIHEQAVRRGLSRLYFVARDGQILSQLAQVCESFRESPVECRYLYGSRRAWLPAGLRKIDSSELRWILGTSPQLTTLREVFGRLNVAPEDHGSFLTSSGFPQETWDGRFDEESFQRLGRILQDDSPLTAEIQARGRARYDRLWPYLKREGVFEQDEVAMVDLGWHGSLKQALARICADAPEGRRPRVIGFYFALVGRASKQSDGFFGYVNSLAPDALGSFLFVQQLLEAFAAADHGQTSDYEEGRPVLAQADHPAVAQGRLEALRGGMLAFSRAYGPLDDASAPDYLRASLSLLDLFYEHPTSEEAGAWGSFPFSDRQVEGALETLLPDWTRGETFLGLFRKEGRARLWWPTAMARSRGMPSLRLYYRLQKLWRAARASRG